MDDCKNNADITFLAQIRKFIKLPQIFSQDIYHTQRRNKMIIILVYLMFCQSAGAANIWPLGDELE